MNNVVMTNQKKKRKGFTLIELIIVLAVMAIIAAIAIPNLAGVSNSAKKKADIQSCETVKRTALTLVATGEMDKDASYTLTPDAEDGDILYKGTTLIEGDVSDSFKDVNKPGYKDQSSYTIDINVDGDVTVTTDADGVTTD